MLAAHSLDAFGLDPICFLLREGKGDAGVVFHSERLSSQSPNGPRNDAEKYCATADKKYNIHKDDLTSISRQIQRIRSAYGCCGEKAAFDKSGALGKLVTKDPTC